MINSILIAEDLKDNRYLLKSILEKKQFHVTEAENGKTALSLFEASPFDLVLTDIHMPEMDGLTLLRAIKQKNPQTPVIIISAYSESDCVIEALRSGACDYITKPYEADAIFNAINRAARVLKSAALERAYTRSLVCESHRFIFNSDPQEVNAIAHFLCQDLEKGGQHNEKQVLQVSLIEALNNAIYHGNLDISSKLKKKGGADGFDQFKELAALRAKTAPYKDRRLTVDYTLNSEEICFVVRDEGLGFDYRTLQNPLDSESFRNPSGRGLLMIRTFCDEVNWNKSGNEITLIKYRDKNGVT